jgi:3D (Asp-Asp-Asp) domain-containing protein
MQMKNKKLYYFMLELILIIICLIALKFIFSYQLWSYKAIERKVFYIGYPVTIIINLPENKEIENQTIETTKLFRSLGEFKITYYCTEKYDHICNNGSPYKTANGSYPIPYETIAVDTNIIPFGSSILIEGKEYIANDRGGYIKGKRIDVAVTNHQEALDLGVKYAEVFIMREN